MSYKYNNPDDAYKEAQRRIKKAKGGITRKSAIALDLYNLGLTVVPSEIGQLKELMKLDLGSNKLTVTVQVVV